MTTKHTRKKAEDWVRAAFEVLAHDGVDGVKVERLARRLGVTKGSFYWHFQNRRALLSAMLAWWEQVGTLRVIERVDARSDAPLVRLRALIEITLRETEGFDHVEAALRRWAATDPDASATIERVDALRLAYVRDLLSASGQREADATIRARLLYRVLIGEYTWRSHGGAALDDAAIDTLASWLESDLDNRSSR